MASIEEIRDVDIQNVLELTETKFEKRGRRVSFLCPAHDDHKLGSCYSFDNNRRWKCYACGAGGDVIRLVQAIKKVGFKDACTWIAANCLADTVEFGAVNSDNKLLSKKKLALIGLSEEDGPVCGAVAAYSDVYMMRAEELLEDEPGGRISWHCSDPDDYVTVDRLLCKQPLRELYEEDEAAYRALICRKATEAKERYTAMLRAAETQQWDSDLERCSIRAASLVGASVWTQCVRNILREIEDIIIEFSDAEEEEEKAPARKKLGSLFGGVI